MCGEWSLCVSVFVDGFVGEDFCDAVPVRVFEVSFGEWFECVFGDSGMDFRYRVAVRRVRNHILLSTGYSNKYSSKTCACVR